MELVLSLNTVTRTVDLTRYPELNQDNDEKCLEIAQTALEIGLKALTHAQGALDIQALQKAVESIMEKANTDFHIQKAVLLSNLAENGRQFDQQHLKHTQDITIHINNVLETHRTIILSQLSLDSPSLAIDRISSILTQQMQQIMIALTDLKTRREIEARSTQGGLSYQEHVGELLRAITLFSDDNCQFVGDKTGTINKVGDFVITLGKTRHARDEKIVVEAKHDMSYSKSKALAECQTARQNREAQIAIFVWDKHYAEAKNQDPIEVQERDIIVLWDADDPATDVYLRAAYWMACCLVVPRIAANPFMQVHKEQIDKAFKEITALSNRLQEIHKAANEINKNAQIILKTSDEIKPLLEASVEFLRQQVTALVDKS